MTAALAALGVTLGLVLVLPGVSASFTSATSGGVSVSGARLAMSLDDSGSTILSISGLKPVDGVVSRCVTVTNTGTAPIAHVAVYAASTSGSGLGSYLNWTVLRGTNGGTTAPTTCWQIGSGSVVWAGRFSSFPTTSATAVDDGGGTLAVGASRAYEVDVSLLDDPAAEGKTVTMSLTWAASL